MKNIVRTYFKKIDYLILIIMTILVFIGLFCTKQAFRLSNEQNIIFMKQFMGIIIGYILIIGIIFIDYRIICKWSFVLYFMIVSILAVTLKLGTNQNNVNRWIMILGIQFQPSELSKIILILFVTYLCSYYKNKLDKVYVLFVLAAVVGLPMILILIEPHLSSCLALLFVFAILVYYSGISYKVIGKALAVIFPIIAGLYIGVALFNIKIPFVATYQVNRVLTFLSTDEGDNLAGDYQQLQSRSSIGSGGLHGKLITSNDDEERMYSNIYANESDFVFTIIAEEFGFMGSLFVVILYGILVIRCLMISSKTSDYMGKLISMGVSAYLMFQIFVNIGVATKLLPNTGLPLPFISYGLTSILSSMIAIGFILSVGVRKSKPQVSPYLN